MRYGFHTFSHFMGGDLKEVQALNSWERDRAACALSKAEAHLAH